jgi:hypothetical protein
MMEAMTPPPRPPVRSLRPATTDPQPTVDRTASNPRTPRGNRRPATPGVPVFVDRSGGRHRLAMLTGTGLAGVLVLGLALMVAGVFGTSPLALPGFPGHYAPAVATQPADGPAAKATTAGTLPMPASDQTQVTTAAPAPSPSAAGTATPSPPATPSGSNTHRHTPTSSPNPHSSKTK